MSEPKSRSVAAVARRTLPVLAAALVASGCASGGAAPTAAVAPRPDPRVGLKPGLLDAGEAIWNLKLVSATPTPKDFVGSTNSDLAFLGSYAIQGNYNGYMVWEIRDPARPELVTSYLCPASQSDVSVYRNLLFVSGEGLEGRLDCGAQGIRTAVSRERLRGLRIFDISDIRNPKNVGNVQTCRGSHTHSVLVDPKDPEHVYVYISGSAGVRPDEELPGCSTGMPDENPETALFRIEVIKVPVRNPGAAAIVSSPRIFSDLEAPPQHGLAPDDLAEFEAARQRGAIIIERDGRPAFIVPDRMVQPIFDSLAKQKGGVVTSADSAMVKGMIQARFVGRAPQRPGPRPGPTQCHDITLYPAIGLAGGACEGYGLLLDITDPVNPKRIAAVADSNFSYWHSATFNNSGTSVIFTDEWGGGGQPKCRANDPKEWGANAIFSLRNRREMVFRSYFKIPAPQTVLENCVAHNGSLIPVPGRDIMVQAWYQGGISVFEFTNPAKPVEIAYHDRGPVDATRMAMGGSWSVYWYNGVIVSSEIARGLDIFELVPSRFLSKNEIEAAKSVTLDYLNPQGQPQFVWPKTVALAGAYADQLERSGGLSGARLAEVRAALADAERTTGPARDAALARLAERLEAEVLASRDGEKVGLLADALRGLAASDLVAR